MRRLPRPAHFAGFFRPLPAAAVAAGLVALLAGGLALDAQSAAPPSFSGGRFGRGQAAESGAPWAGSGKAGERQREGTRITGELGTFQNTGDRVAFLPAGNRESYRVLENLALERIDRALDGSAGQRQWIISGVLTEYRGSNYLLITKAVLQLQEGDSAVGP